MGWLISTRRVPLDHGLESFCSTECDEAFCSELRQLSQIGDHWEASESVISVSGKAELSVSLTLSKLLLQHFENSLNQGNVRRLSLILTEVIVEFKGSSAKLVKFRTVGIIALDWR